MAMGLQGVLPRYCKGIVDCGVWTAIVDKSQNTLHWPISLSTWPNYLSRELIFAFAFNWPILFIRYDYFLFLCKENYPGNSWRRPQMCEDAFFLFFCVCVFAHFCFFVLLAHFVCLLATVDAGHRCVGRRKQGLMAQYLVAIPPYCRHWATSTFFEFLWMTSQTSDNATKNAQ